MLHRLTPAVAAALILAIALPSVAAGVSAHPVRHPTRSNYRAYLRGERAAPVSHPVKRWICPETPDGTQVPGPWCLVGYAGGSSAPASEAGGGSGGYTQLPACGPAYWGQTLAVQGYVWYCPKGGDHWIPR